MGVASDSTQRAFASTDVAGFLNRKIECESIDPFSYPDENATQHFFVAVDPAGGGASQFAVASVLQLPTGQVVVRSHV